MNAECQDWTFDESIDLGLGPVRSRRGPLGRAATEVLDRFTMLGAAA